MAIVRPLVVMLVLGALLNTPALLGTSGWAGTGCGQDPQAGPEIVADAAEGNGNARSTVTFPSGGSDTSFRVSAPGNSLLLSASLTLEGMPAIPPPVQRKYSFSDTKNNVAFEGLSKDYPPTGKPTSFQEQLLPSGSYQSVAAEDDSTHATLGYGIGCPYHLFSFRVFEDALVGLSVRWVGMGYDLLMLYSGVDAYIWNSGRWENFGSFGTQDIDMTMQVFTRNCQIADDYVDSAGRAYVLVMGPYGIFGQMLESDYVEITVLGSTASWPTDVTVDAGNDGKVDYRITGKFNGTMIVGMDEMGPAMQSAIDAAGPNATTVDIPFRFSSTTAGSIVLDGGAFEFDRAPEALGVPPEKLMMEEDSSRPLVIDLNSCFRDDRDTLLEFSVAGYPRESFMQADVDTDAHTVSIRSVVKDWYGRCSFTLRATDSSGLFGTLGLNITVTPVNDAPVLEFVLDQYAKEDTVFVLALNASDVDGPVSDLSFADDSPLFEVDRAAGRISFTPTNDEVGLYAIMVMVEDAHGARCARVFNLTVENVNDAPVMAPVEDVSMREHDEFDYTVRATDVDAFDALEYSVESDIAGLEANPSTGRIEFRFASEHIGEHLLLLVAQDASGAKACQTLRLTVENVNDAPVLKLVGKLKAVQGQKFEHRFEASDSDAGDVLSFRSDLQIAKVDTVTGILKFTPTNADVGEHVFTVTVRDAAGLSAEMDIVLEVENVNDAPHNLKILAPVTNSELHAGERILLSASADDPDIGDAEKLTFTWKDNGNEVGSGASLEVRLKEGLHTLTLEVSDGVLVNSTAITLTVAAASPATQAWRLPLPWPMLLALVAFSGASVAAAALYIRRRKGGAGASKPGTPNPAPPAPPTAGAVPAPWPGAMLPSPPPMVNQAAGVPPPPFSALVAHPVPGAQPPVAAPYYYASAPEPHPFLRPMAPPPHPAYFGAAPGPAGQRPMVPPVRPDQLPGMSGRGPQHPPSGARPQAVSSVQGPAPSLPTPTTPPVDMNHLVMPMAFAAMGTGMAPAGTGRMAMVMPGDPDDEGLEDRPRPPASASAAAPRMPVRMGDDAGVYRDAMRTAINDAKQAMDAARAIGVRTQACERVLAEAIASSYRLDYGHARSLAKKAEGMALELMGREDRLHNGGGQGHGSGEAEEAV